MASDDSATQQRGEMHQKNQRANLKLIKFMYVVASSIWGVFLLKPHARYKVEWRRVYNYESV